MERLAQAVLDVTRRRLRQDPVPLGGARTTEELAGDAGPTVTPDGLGGDEALRIWTEVLAPACIAIDHPRYLSFIPGAPTQAASLFDVVVGASSIYAGTWFEAAGAVHAENEALRWLADLAGFPPEAGGTFVQGGTLGNLSALVAARDAALRRRGGRPDRWTLACSAEVHSSVLTAARVMDLDVLDVPLDAAGRMTGAALDAALLDHPGDGVFAVVATAGTTQFGTVDDLHGLAEVARAHGLWLHVDGAYGLAALAAPSVHDRFAGIEDADSFIVDPHKWLFAPFDACALVYRDAAGARRAHAQSAGYLEVVAGTDGEDPSDYGVHLSRRARGLPFWFSLAVHGTRAYEQAVERGLSVARAIAAEIRARPDLELLHDPELSVLVFRRRGWSAADYHAWSQRLAADGFAFVMPTVHAGETVARMVVVNPRTTAEDLVSVLDTLA